MKKISIGARGSKLSLIQAEIVKKLLEALNEEILVSTTIITTKGDKDMRPVPLDIVGKGWFTKELDKALLAGSIDIAVHSLKDVPEELPDGLVLAAIPEREDAREALVSRGNKPFAKLKKGAVIGTDSVRRKAQILFKRPDLVVTSLRGNVNTRVKKLDAGEYDGIFLAVAGLKRLGLAERISEYFPVTDIVPSPGQGALAIVCKKENKPLLRLLQKLNHEQTVCAVKAERAFSKAFGGGCKSPVGAYAKCSEKDITLYGFVGAIDGTQEARGSITGSLSSPEKIGKTLASRLMKQSKSWFNLEPKKYVVITRQASENKSLQKKLEAKGLTSYSYPTITIRKKRITEKEKKELLQITSFDWVLFTSKNSVRYFMKMLTDLRIGAEVLDTLQIGAVGVKTAETVMEFGLQVKLIPQVFTTEDLGKSFKDIKDKKFLLPRADIATGVLPNLLKKKGAAVVEIPIYTTTFVTKPNNEFAQLFETDQIACLTFTSPSTIIGFMKSLSKSLERKKLFSLPVVVIGPVTEEEAKEQGFKNIFVADTYTTEGLVSKVAEVIL